MLGLNVIFTREGTVLSTESFNSKDTFDTLVKGIATALGVDSSVGLK